MGEKEVRTVSALERARWALQGCSWIKLALRLRNWWRMLSGVLGGAWAEEASARVCEDSSPLPQKLASRWTPPSALYQSCNAPYLSLHHTNSGVRKDHNFAGFNKDGGKQDSCRGSNLVSLPSHTGAHLQKGRQIKKVLQSQGSGSHL